MIQEIINIFFIVVGYLGGIGIFTIIMLEYSSIPISSEIMLPFIGVMVYSKVFTYGEAIFWSISGGIVGSLIGYYIGFMGGKKVIRYREKKYLGIEETILEFNRWFNKYGEKAICICRILPMTRNLISIASGAKKVDLKGYIAYSTLGITIWNTGLIVLGYFIGRGINSVEGALEKCYIIAYVSIILTIIYFLLKKVKKKRPHLKNL